MDIGDLRENTITGDGKLKESVEGNILFGKKNPQVESCSFVQF